MSTFGTMQARIADELLRSSLAAPIAKAIKTAIAYWETTRFAFNEGDWTRNTVASTEGYGFPSDLAAIDDIIITVSGSRYRLKLRHHTWLNSVSLTTTALGQPGYYAAHNRQFRLYPIPDAAYALKLYGVQHFAELSDADDTNAWMTEAEELIRQRAKAIVRIDALDEAAARQEALALGATRFLSLMERQAYLSLMAETEAHTGTGYTRAYVM